MNRTSAEEHSIQAISPEFVSAATVSDEKRKSKNARESLTKVMCPFEILS